MTLKKLIYWFVTTLVIGCLAAVTIGVSFEQFAGQEMVGTITGELLLGLTLGAVAELGFFAFLVFNWLAKGLLRNKTVYDSVMFLLILVLLGNLIYLNHVKYSGESFWLHLVIPAVMVLSAMIVASLKKKQTNSGAYIPTLFYMIAATAIEAIPSLNPKEGEIPFLIIMHSVLVLLVCNAWQILQLHRWIQVTSARNKGKTQKNKKRQVDSVR
ncbi:KinB-signaling pathway activation protein [Thermoactinomyces mirandus]|uniref:KinB-signaling pathway activation protein n=1 Tax=Thermoactinomyces mirandus TaxID=2756294 RepID=A0A7W1XUA2_9BACL|nr:KinB-signaling pathway activation protein [Thermoactinomyces mirandus]MBA4603212.1 KinB-signaling pathway activation protein [Thermoactinomyces mirandus]